MDRNIFLLAFDYPGKQCKKLELISLRTDHLLRLQQLHQLNCISCSWTQRTCINFKEGIPPKIYRIIGLKWRKAGLK